MGNDNNDAAILLCGRFDALEWLFGCRQTLRERDEEATSLKRTEKRF